MAQVGVVLSERSLVSAQVGGQAAGVGRCKIPGPANSVVKLCLGGWTIGSEAGSGSWGWWEWTR